MTVGERIQYHRKEMDLSQEELGQMLLVSRQTVSQWENGQTYPTVDNLIRLRSLFGISVDELLDLTAEEALQSQLPLEEYKFMYPESELSVINRQWLWMLAKRALPSLAFLLLFIIAGCIFVEGNFSTGAVFGLILCSFLTHCFTILRTRKSMQRTSKWICRNCYHYKLYEDRLELSVTRGGAERSHISIPYSEIENGFDIGDYLLLQINNALYIVCKANLKESSRLNRYVQKKPGDKKTLSRNLLDTLGTIVFVIAILSFFVAQAISTEHFAVDDSGRAFLWYFWFLPVPVASIVFGVVLWKNGLKYKKNIIAGIIVALLMGMSGSEYFLWSSTNDSSDATLEYVEETLSMDFPEQSHSRTQDFTSYDVHTIDRLSSITFDEAENAQMKDMVEADDRWIRVIPTDLYGIHPVGSVMDGYDYYLIYNVDLKTFNQLPDEAGTYHYISIAYSVDRRNMEIEEYQMEYIE